MEDIYDDLCNYEDVNALQELRDENKALKVKLEEHSAAMEKLQKDYDTLDMEYKTLLKNYSSLLMTARSEVKRKTEMITQLNVEKDLMVLNALKSGKDIRRNFYQGAINPGKMNNDRASSQRGNNKYKEDYVNQRNDDPKHERRQTPILPPKDADPDSGICNKSKSDNAGKKVELSNNRKSRVNENIAQRKTEHNAPPKTSASSIKDRRKSMPAVSIPPDVFSSDEELERNYQTKDTRTDHLRCDNERRNINKMTIDGHSNKATSETSSVDDRGHINQESTLRDSYKGRSSRHHDSTTYRGRDKYEISLKYRKQYSPERGQKRQYREHQDDYHRHERGRYQGRSQQSPPPEYYKSYDRHPHWKSDHRSDYDRYIHDHEKNRHRHDSKYSSNYRSKDHDEPQTKRQRIESYGNPDAHSMEGKRHHHERESMELAPNFSPHEYDMLRYSCQSPDFVHTDAALAHPIKEIMATAATPLEDPRVTSTKYVTWKENGTETISTMVGRNIYIRPVNKAVWNIKTVDIPVALVRRPSQCNDTHVNDIYTNLDLSTESSEVRETGDEINVIRSNPKEIQHVAQDFKISEHKISEQVPEDLLKQATDLETVSKPNVAKNRIAKTGQNNKNTHSKMDVPVTDVDENVPHHKNVYGKGAAEDSFAKKILTNKQQYNEREERVNVKVKDFLPNNKNYSKIEGNKKSRSRDRGENQNQAILTKIAIVADDLELSDDNSDHMDTKRKLVSDKLQKNEMALNINEARTDSVNNVVNKTLTSSHNTEIERTVDTAEIQDVAEEEKTKESDSTKKHKNKKKKSKSKEMSKGSAETKADAIHVPEKKPKSKKEKESKSKETKEKFSDLFGDSNSLMTPEDLGIPSYLPITEDAQDAVDMKFNKIIDAASLINKDEIPSDTKTQNIVEIKTQATKAHDDIPKAVLQISNTDVENREVVKEIKKKKSSKRNEEIIDPKQLPSPIVYENLNPGIDLNDPNVVKTVIISTGIQPGIAYENKIDVTKPASDVEINVIQNTKDIHPFPTTKEFKRDILKALATSTPQKEFSPVNPLPTDVICDPRVSTAVASITNAGQVVNQTERNTLESNDAPDLRIFVKRRRKVVKRPMT